MNKRIGIIVGLILVVVLSGCDAAGISVSKGNIEEDAGVGKEGEPSYEGNPLMLALEEELEQEKTDCLNAYGNAIEKELEEASKYRFPEDEIKALYYLKDYDNDEVPEMILVMMNGNDYAYEIMIYAYESEKVTCKLRMGGYHRGISGIKSTEDFDEIMIANSPGTVWYDYTRVTSNDNKLEVITIEEGMGQTEEENSYYRLENEDGTGSGPSSREEYEVFEKRYDEMKDMVFEDFTEYQK